MDGLLLNEVKRGWPEEWWQPLRSSSIFQVLSAVLIACMQLRNSVICFFHAWSLLCCRKQ
jgi:hypothetical protein